MADPVAEGETAVTCERPCLAGSGQVERKSTGEDQDGGDGVERDDASWRHSLAEHPHVRVARGIVKRSLDISDHEHVADEEDDAQHAVHEVRANHSTRHCLAGILDLLRHMGCGVGTYGTALVYPLRVNSA